MSPTAKLAIVACLISSVTAYSAYLGMNSSWQYYLTVEECLIQAAELANQRVRVNGVVVAGSLESSAHSSSTTFHMGSAEHPLRVEVHSALPDNFATGLEVVVEGRIGTAGVLQADKVITRCASKYERVSEKTSADRQQTVVGIRAR